MNYELTDSSPDSLGYRPKELTDSSSDSLGYRPKEKNTRQGDGCHSRSYDYQTKNDIEGSKNMMPLVSGMIPGDRRGTLGIERGVGQL